MANGQPLSLVDILAGIGDPATDESAAAERKAKREITDFLTTLREGHGIFRDVDTNEIQSEFKDLYGLLTSNSATFKSIEAALHNAVSGRSVDELARQRQSLMPRFGDEVIPFAGDPSSVFHLPHIGAVTDKFLEIAKNAAGTEDPQTMALGLLGDMTNNRYGTIYDSASKQLKAVFSGVKDGQEAMRRYELLTANDNALLSTMISGAVDADEEGQFGDVYQGMIDGLVARRGGYGITSVAGRELDEAISRLQTGRDAALDSYRSWKDDATSEAAAFMSTGLQEMGMSTDGQPDTSINAFFERGEYRNMLNDATEGLSFVASEEVTESGVSGLVTSMRQLDTRLSLIDDAETRMNEMHRKLLTLYDDPALPADYKDRVGALQKLLKNQGGKQVETYMEQLIGQQKRGETLADPVEVIDGLLVTLQTGADGQGDSYTKIIGEWKEDLRKQEKTAFMARAKNKLRELNLDPDSIPANFFEDNIGGWTGNSWDTEKLNTAFDTLALDQRDAETAARIKADYGDNQVDFWDTAEGREYRNKPENKGKELTNADVNTALMAKWKGEAEAQNRDLGNYLAGKKSEVEFLKRYPEEDSETLRKAWKTHQATGVTPDFALQEIVLDRQAAAAIAEADLTDAETKEANRLSDELGLSMAQAIQRVKNKRFDAAALEDAKISKGFTPEQMDQVEAMMRDQGMSASQAIAKIEGDIRDAGAFETANFTPAQITEARALMLSRGLTASEAIREIETGVFAEGAFAKANFTDAQIKEAQEIMASRGLSAAEAVTEIQTGVYAEGAFAKANFTPEQITKAKEIMASRGLSASEAIAEMQKEQREDVLTQQQQAIAGVRQRTTPGGEVQYDVGVAPGVAEELERTRRGFRDTELVRTGVTPPAEGEDSALSRWLSGTSGETDEEGVIRGQGFTEDVGRDIIRNTPGLAKAFQYELEVDPATNKLTDASVQKVLNMLNRSRTTEAEGTGEKFEVAGLDWDDLQQNPQKFTGAIRGIIEQEERKKQRDKEEYGGLAERMSQAGIQGFEDDPVLGTQAATGDLGSAPTTPRTGAQKLKKRLQSGEDIGHEMQAQIDEHTREVQRRESAAGEPVAGTIPETQERRRLGTGRTGTMITRAGQGRGGGRGGGRQPRF